MTRPLRGGDTVSQPAVEPSVVNTTPNVLSCQDEPDLPTWWPTAGLRWRDGPSLRGGVVTPEMGSRRLGGVVLLIAVLLGSVLVSRVGGVRVTGSAVAAPRAGAPQVGDCLREVTGPLAIQARSGFPPLPLSVVSVGDSSVSFSDCSDQHQGEVVAFRLTPQRNGGVVTADDSDTQWCSDIAVGNRLRATSLYWAASGRLWEPATNQRFVAILGASPESWAVCAVLAPGLELYSGSLVQSLAGHRPPAPFGQCRSGGKPDRRVSCISPHRIQEFGSAVQSSLPDPGAEDDCVTLVQAMTGLPDVKAGGVLRIQVVGGGGSAAAGGGERGRCQLIAVGSNLLIGTLIGIGTGTLPLA